MQIIKKNLNIKWKLKPRKNNVYNETLKRIENYLSIN